MVTMVTCNYLLIPMRTGLAHIVIGAPLLGTVLLLEVT